MKLVDLNPRWVGAGGSDITQNGQPVPERHGVAITFDCPCGRRDDNDHAARLCIEFTQPLDGGPALRNDGHTWNRTGDTFETLTLAPSIQVVGGCGWHGHLQNGVLRSC